MNDLFCLAGVLLELMACPFERGGRFNVVYLFFRNTFLLLLSDRLAQFAYCEQQDQDQDDDEEQ
jgi:hypothetical protein